MMLSLIVVDQPAASWSHIKTVLFPSTESRSKLIDVAGDTSVPVVLTSSAVAIFMLTISERSDQSIDIVTRLSIVYGSPSFITAVASGGVVSSRIESLNILLVLTAASLKAT